MKQITREWLAFLREQYPVGSRIRLNSMEDPYAPVEPGTMGTLQRIDDAGQFLMKWDNGRTLSLIPGEDSFSLILPEPTMMKLYMPLHADLYTKDDWSDTSEEPEMLTGRALMEYEDSILIALIKNRMSEEAERGIMRWYTHDISEFTEWLVDAVKLTIEAVRNGTYNESVARLLPYKHRTGVITRAGLWKLYPEEKESFFEALTQEDVDEFLATGTEDCTGLPELKEMTANDFYRFCALGYPMMSWPHMTRCYMVFGHIHGNTDADYWPLIRENDLMLNAGADVNGFAPVTFEEMQENNYRHKAGWNPELCTMEADQ